MLSRNKKFFKKVCPGTTALDKVHQSMLLFASGRSEALKRFLVEEGIGRYPPLLATGASAVGALSVAIRRETLGRWGDGEEEVVGIFNVIASDRRERSNLLAVRKEIASSG